MLLNQSTGLLRNSAMKHIQGIQALHPARKTGLRPLQPIGTKSVSSKTIQKPISNNALQAPVSPQIALIKYLKLMTHADQSDIKQYKTIYFIRNQEPPPSIPKVASTSRVERSSIFQFERGAHIAFRYEQLEVIGSGSYGLVLRCYDHKQKRDVSIKLMSGIEQKQNDLEVEFMKRLDSAKNPQENYIVDLLNYFTFRGYNCVVTELLSINLYCYFKANRFSGLSLSEVKRIGLQVAKALQYIHSMGIVHSDMKPENIVFVANPSSIPVISNKVKIIDFGCSCYDKQPLYKVVQSLYYRCPEVIFNFKYARQIDVWSYGCILFELLTGSPLFRCKTEPELIREIQNLLGLPPPEMVARSAKMQEYFKPNHPVNRESCNQTKLEILQMRLSHLNNSQSLKYIIKLIGACLEWLPAKRITMDAAVAHPFFQ